jgi:hypothetical protein
MQANTSATAPAKAAAVSVQRPAAVASAACAAGTVVAPVSAQLHRPRRQVTCHQAGQQQDQAGYRPDRAGRAERGGQGHGQVGCHRRAQQHEHAARRGGEPGQV